MNKIMIHHFRMTKGADAYKLALVLQDPDNGDIALGSVVFPFKPPSNDWQEWEPVYELNGNASDRLLAVAQGVEPFVMGGSWSVSLADILNLVIGPSDNPRYMPSSWPGVYASYYFDHFRDRQRFHVTVPHNLAQTEFTL